MDELIQFFLRMVRNLNVENAWEVGKNIENSNHLGNIEANLENEYNKNSKILLTRL